MTVGSRIARNFTLSRTTGSHTTGSNTTGVIATDAVLRHNPGFLRWKNSLDKRGSPRHLLEKTRAMVTEQIEKIKQEYTDK